MSLIREVRKCRTTESSPARQNKDSSVIKSRTFNSSSSRAIGKTVSLSRELFCRNGNPHEVEKLMYDDQAAATTQAATVWGLASRRREQTDPGTEDWLHLDSRTALVRPPTAPLQMPARGVCAVSAGSALLPSMKALYLCSGVWLCDPMDCSLPGSLCPRDFPGENTVVDCDSLPQGIFSTQGQNLSLFRLLHCRRVLYHWAIGKPVKVLDLDWLWNGRTLSLSITTMLYLGMKTSAKMGGVTGLHSEYLAGTFLPQQTRKLSSCWVCINVISIHYRILPFFHWTYLP